MRWRYLLVPVLLLALAGCGGDDENGGDGEAATSSTTETTSAEDVPESIAALTAQLTGVAEAPGPGAVDGAGTASLEISPTSGRTCSLARVEGIQPATAAHIHEGAEGVAGPVVVTLATPGDEPALECVEADVAVVQRILANPASFYVNVHTADFPDGAVRGQLGAGG